MQARADERREGVRGTEGNSGTAVRAARTASAGDGPSRFDDYLRDEVRDAFAATMEDVFQNLSKSQGATEETRRSAKHLATQHFWNRFRREYPEFADPGKPERLDAFLRRQS